ncbi:MAG: carboxymuconolactone decarboxylase family protein [Alistipes indistinctus]
MDRIELCRKNYTALFGGEALTGTGTDPELMDILQKYIFGEVFAVGDLDLKTRELITCTVLSVMQTLPQLKAHAAAALTAGVTPVELREAVYQCAPFVGFPKTLNAVSVVNEVFRERGISLPLEAQGTVTEADRYRRGATIQHRLYGDEAGQKTTYVPGGVGGDVARLLTGFCFGDFMPGRASI